MKLYEVNGVTRRYPEGHAPKGAILVSKARPAPKATPARVVEDPEEVKVETPKAAEPKSKARKTRNKSRKAENNK